MRRLLTAVAALAVLAGCSADEADPVTEAEPAEITEEPTEEPEPPADDEQAYEDSQGTGVLAFGDTFSWPSGVEITVGTPWVERELESDEDYDEHSTVMVYFPVTVRNLGGEPYEPSEAFHTVSSGGHEGTWVAEADGPPFTALLPDKEISYELSYAVADPSDLTLDLTPEGLMWEPAFWVGSAE